ncbi:molybdate ABC transporter substrate-binding protein [Arthrobacter sp. B0490]|uniref:molybdate ABC transporter substrate-binding protein n=1 Tax=Arthrobacter sp. B0490 TaxID=2058891 RepID=UPI0021573B4F|nr:molybdate ABC transporter substrate-binding protein [Arthrobacter sp. B0490]
MPSNQGSALALATAVVFLAGACGAGGPDAGDGAVGGAAGEAIGGSITVFAAASLTASFTDLAARFEEAHPDAEVALNFAGSSDLAIQIIEGAPADVLATADAENMGKVRDAGMLTGDPVDFATNTLQLAVPPDNPAGITSLPDAAAPGVKTVVCAGQVPCGAAAAAVEQAAGVDLEPVSEESSVADVLGKVTSGEADAGLVYRTDVRAAAGTVRGIDVPEAAGVVNTYPIAALPDSADAATAEAFVDFVTGTEGQAVLRAAGFGAP